MQTGIRAQGPNGDKLYVTRHGHKRGVARRSYAAAEKALETKVRQRGKKECQETDA